MSDTARSQKHVVSWFGISLLQALNGGRRLVAHHANILLPQLHSFVLLAMPSVEALRSTTSKAGMLLVQVNILPCIAACDVQP